MRSIKHSPRSTSRRHLPRRAWFAVIVFFAPIMFFILVEMGLRLAGYGSDIPQWIEVAPGKLMLNTDIGRRYFRHVRIIPMSNQDVFDKEKRGDAFRAFILGESSGAGYPYAPNGSFSRWLRRYLEILYPSCTIEIVNLSMTAINSHTLRDLFPGVLEHQPDLVLIYAGHNEYYGALGVGSAETAGAHRTLVRLALFLSRFKTFELVRNTAQAIGERLSGPPPPRDGTLMSRMAKDQSIPLYSDRYDEGLRQFDENMSEILSDAQENGVPVIMGTLVNNLRDQPPFISNTQTDVESADNTYQKAHEALLAHQRSRADSLFRLAKDLDLLRFRAPEAMNHLIRKLGSTYGALVVDMDSLFSSRSPDGIIGDNLMTDHLHPTLDGYRLMGSAFLQTMRDNQLLPSCPSRSLSADSLDLVAEQTFAMSRLDTILAGYRIALLKNDWPYIDKRQRRPVTEVLRPADEVERAAFDIVADKESWEAAHRSLAEWYLSRQDHKAFLREMNVLITQFPVIVEYYDFAAQELLKVERFDEAFEFLSRRNTIRPDAFASKWMGIIQLSRGATHEAIALLEASLRGGRSDPQALYNLAGAYSRLKEYAKALAVIQECLALDPQFPSAIDLRQQLLRATGS